MSVCVCYCYQKQQRVVPGRVLPYLNPENEIDERLCVCVCAVTELVRTETL